MARRCSVPTATTFAAVWPATPPAVAGRSAKPRSGLGWLASQKRGHGGLQPIPRPSPPFATPPTHSRRPSATKSRRGRKGRESSPSCASTTSARPTPWPASCASARAERDLSRPPPDHVGGEIHERSGLAQRGLEVLAANVEEAVMGLILEV